MNLKNIIKADTFSANRNLRRTTVIKSPVLTAQETARQIVAAAEDAVRNLHAAAELEAAELHLKTYAEANEKALAEFEDLLLEAREIRDCVLQEVESDVLRLAVKLAEKIVGREIKRDKNAIADMVAAALQNARQQERLTVRVNPADLPKIQENIERFAGGGRTRFIDFVADPRVTTSGCIIESEVGTVDARLETQLRILERALLSQAEGDSLES